MHVVAVSVEPEFVILKDLGGGAVSLTFELARLQVTEAHITDTGSVQLTLLAADIDTVTEQLGAIVSCRREALE